MSSSTFILPDFFANCPYQARLNPLTDVVTKTAQEWILTEANYDDDQRARFLKIGGGILAGYCYPNADSFHLQVCGDWLDWAFVLDDWTDGYTDTQVQSTVNSIKRCLRDPHSHQDNAPICRLAKDLFDRFFKTAGPRCAKRFIRTMDLYVDGVFEESAVREHGALDLEGYIALRRETSGVRPCLVLIESAAGIDLPNEVIEHPVIRSMEDATNDWVSWTNDIFSYNKEQAAGDPHNLIAVLMRDRNLKLQSAVDLAGQLCFDCIAKFEADREVLPSWGLEIDRLVDIYIQGLQDWIIGSLHWSFSCQRYFGSEGEEIKKHRVVNLQSREARSVRVTC